MNSMISHQLSVAMEIMRSDGDGGHGIFALSLVDSDDADGKAITMMRVELESIKSSGSQKREYYYKSHRTHSIFIKLTRIETAHYFHPSDHSGQ
jgi:hypothetical protein